MQRLTLALILEAIGAAIAIFLLGSFLGDHFAVVTYAVSAGVLLVSQIALLNSLIRQIVLARQIDYARPIAEIQGAIERLRLLRVRTTQAVIAGVLLAWPPLLIVLFAWLFGVNAYQIFGPAYVWSCIALGLAAIPVAVWLARRMESRAGASPPLRYLMRSINGSAINEANDFLAKLSAFENENSPSAMSS
jgi:hypothetical protein